MYPCTFAVCPISLLWVRQLLPHYGPRYVFYNLDLTQFFPATLSSSWQHLSGDVCLGDRRLLKLFRAVLFAVIVHNDVHIVAVLTLDCWFDL